MSKAIYCTKELVQERTKKSDLIVSKNVIKFS
jgi:hypothetical protein